MTQNARESIQVSAVADVADREAVAERAGDGGRSSPARWSIIVRMLLLFANQPPYHEALLHAAKTNLDAHQHAIALVIAHMACEVLTEQAISAAFKARGVEWLDDAVTDGLPSRNLGNDRVLAVYVALTNDPIQTATFWQKFKETSALRNKAVHHGRRITADEGRIACEAAEAMVTHLSAVMRKLIGAP